MFDFSNFVNYPTWFKCAVFAWAALTLLLSAASLIIKPADKSNTSSGKYINQPQIREEKIMDSKLPPINAPNSVVSINQQGGQTAKTIHNVTINSSERIIPQNILQELNLILRNRPGKVSIRIANNEMQGQEPVRFAEMMHNLFSSSGWESSVFNSHNMIANGVITTGVTINAIGQNNAQLADFICRQLNSIGVRSSYKSYSSSDEPKDLFIEVWTK